ncbi:NAD(P)-binding protein [Nonomuraea dietziae]
MIIVIGAGQAGLAAGRALRLAGHDVLLLDAHPAR